MGGVASYRYPPIMNGNPLNPLEIAGFVAIGTLAALAIVALGWWLNRLVREYHETKRARGVALSEFFVELRAGKPEALEKAQKEIGH